MSKTSDIALGAYYAACNALVWERASFYWRDQIQRAKAPGQRIFFGKQSVLCFDRAAYWREVEREAAGEYSAMPLAA